MITSRALTFYKSIHATTLPWAVVKAQFRAQFMSRTKKAEITAELDVLHMSTLRSETYSDPEALGKLIHRLDKL